MSPVAEPLRVSHVLAQGESFEALGQVANYFIPLLAVLAVLVGLFASSTYDEGATVFLDAPKSAEDSAKLVPAVQLQGE